MRRCHMEIASSWLLANRITIKVGYISILRQEASADSKRAKTEVNKCTEAKATVAPINIRKFKIR